MMRFSPGSGLKLALLSVALVCMWQFGPSPIGKSTFLITHGNSMEPKFHKGDLVVTRAASSYKQGDIVAYRSKTINSLVLHRIVDVESSNFIMKGDNNSWLDTDHPAMKDVVGVAVLHVPNAGFLVQNKPVALFLAAGVPLVVAIVRRRRPSSSSKPLQRTAVNTSRIRPGLLVVALSGCMGLLLVIVGFTREESTITNKAITLDHHGSTTYSALTTDASAVYLDGLVKTGDPIYSQILDKVDFTYTYRLGSAPDRDIRVTGRLEVEISDVSGWSRSMTLDERHDVDLPDGDELQMKGQLDIARLRDLTNAFEARSGMTRDAYNVSVLVHSKIIGTVQETPVAEVFEPKLNFRLDPVQLQYVPGSVPTEMFESSAGGLIEIPTTQSNTLHGVPVGVLRSLGIAMLVPSMTYSCVAVIRRRRSGVASADPKALRTEYAHMIVDDPLGLQSWDSVVAVGSFEHLYVLAVQLNRLIHHHVDGSVNRFMVYDSHTAFEFRIDIS